VEFYYCSGHNLWGCELHWSESESNPKACFVINNFKHSYFITSELL